jgi:hypothetical protein
VREHRLQALLGQFRAFARVTEIVRYQVEALRLRGAVSGEINDTVSSGSARFSPHRAAQLLSLVVQQLAGESLDAARMLALVAS